MNITFHVEPRAPHMDAAEFRRVSPPYSIALDGYVKGPPWLDEDGPRANYNHHEDVYRPATRATCGQVLVEARTGLFKRFRDENGIRIEGFMRDCDQDVCTSKTLLNNPALTQSVYNPRLNRLVYMEDLYDTTSGAYPFPIDMPVLEQLAWVFQPYTKFKQDGGLDRGNADAYRNVIDDVEQRILRHVNGDGDKIPLHIDYDVIGGGPGWSMVVEHGAQARTAMFSRGIDAFVSARDLGNGRWAYSIGRMAPTIPFDVLGILAMLNEVERCIDICWGGSNTIGGSPFLIGSSIDPQQLQELINGWIAAKTAAKAEARRNSTLHI